LEESARDPAVLDYPGLPTNEGGNARVPLGEYLVECVERNRQELRRRKWASPLFHFLRWAQAHADLAGRTAAEAFQRIEAALGALTAPECAWQRAFGVSRATAESECSALPRMSGILQNGNFTEMKDTFSSDFDDTRHHVEQITFHHFTHPFASVVSSPYLAPHPSAVAPAPEALRPLAEP